MSHDPLDEALANMSEPAPTVYVGILASGTRDGRLPFEPFGGGGYGCPLCGAVVVQDRRRLHADWHDRIYPGGGGGMGPQH